MGSSKPSNSSRRSTDVNEYFEHKRVSSKDSYNLLSMIKKENTSENQTKLPGNLGRSSRNSIRKTDKSTDNLSRKSSSKQRLPVEEYNLNRSWLGSKENLGLNPQKTPSCRLDLNRYAKSKNSTPLDSHRTNKVSTGSLEVKEFDRIPTLHDRFEKRREASDLMVSQLSKFDINNDRINSFRNKCKEYEKLTSGKSLLQAEEINATRKNTGSNDNENSQIKIAQNLSKTKMKNSSIDMGNCREMNVSDLQFLFSKKLSNVDKLSLLKLKKAKEEITSARVKDDQSNTREGGSSELSYTNFIERKTSARVPDGGSLSKDSFRPVESSAQSFGQAAKGRPGSTSKDTMIQESQYTLNTPRKEVQPKNIIIYQKSQREREIEELGKKSSKLDKEEKEKKIKELENRFKNKRCSVPEENDADRIAKEFDFNIDMKKISMTPDISRRGSLEPLPQKREPQKRELDLNSRLILNTLISDVGKTEEQYMESLEFERRNLIDYIGSSIESTGKVPRTTLQFYKVNLHHQILKMIGKGSFGKVHLGIHILSKKKVAIKCIDKTYIKEEKAQKKIVQEVKILRSLIHRNIIKILEVFENKKFVFIVTDFASRGDLLKYMKEHGVFKEHRAKPIVAQILKALEYCHAKKILHRDIKLDNILLDKDMQVKLCDFGVSRFMTDEVIKERCGTPAYIAPEIINGNGYSRFQADVCEFFTKVWSLGVLMYALTTGTIPFKAKNIPDLHKLILKNDFDFPEGIDLTPAFRNLIRYVSNLL